VVEMDTDGPLVTTPDVIISGPANEPKVINGLEIDNGVKREWNAIFRGPVFDPRLYSLFGKSVYGKNLTICLKLSNEEKIAWKYDIGAWADHYVKQYPSVFMPTLYSTLHTYMKEISD
jgi:hypothetical protein